MDLSTITKQPSSGNEISTFPVTSGLESLDRLDHFIIKQKKVERLEAVTVFDKEGQQIFGVSEETATFTRLLCCGSCRSFNMIISDMQGQEVMHLLVKPFNMEVEVTGSGTVMGSVVNHDKCLCLPKLQVKNEFEETVLTVDVPCSALPCCSVDRDIDFTLTSQDTGLEVFIDTFKHKIV